VDEFDGLMGFEQWRDKLLSLLEEAASMKQDASMQARVLMSGRLRSFMVASPADEAIDALDPVAAEAARGVLEQGIEARLASLAARTAELKAVTRDLERRADEARRAASALRLEKTTAAVRSVTESIASLRELAGSLAAADGDLATRVKDAVDALQAARAKLEGLAG
jgi:hypothetical protein